MGNGRITAGRVGLLALALFFLGVMLSEVVYPIPAEDIWWTLKSAEVQLRTGHAPTQDVFSYSAAGRPWLHQEWLAGIVYFWLHKAGGFSALYVFKAIAVAGAYALSIALAARRSRVAFALIAFFWMIALISDKDQFDIRAFLFTYLFLVVTLLILENAYAAGRKRLLYLLIPLTWLWSNLHGGYIISIVVQAIYWISYSFDRWRARRIVPAPTEESTGAQRRRRQKRKREMARDGLSFLDWPAVAVLFTCLAAAALGPYGLETLKYPFSFWFQPFYKNYIIEWRHPEFWHGDWVFTATLVVLAVLMWTYRSRFRTVDWLLALAFGYLGCDAKRHIPLFTLAVLPIAALAIEGIWSSISRRADALLQRLTAGPRVAAAALAAAGAAAFLVRTFEQTHFEDLNREKALLPSAAVQFLKDNHIPGHMYNAYEWGGYLIWNLFPDYQVMIDGRANTVYPEKLYVAHIACTYGNPGWQYVLDQYDVNFCVLNKFYREVRGQRLIDNLARSQEWVRIFEDQVEVIFIRNLERNREIIEKARQGELKTPETPYKLTQAAEKLAGKSPADAERLLNQAIEMNSAYIPALVKLADIESDLGKREQARALLKRAAWYVPELRTKLKQLDEQPTPLRPGVQGVTGGK